MQNIDIIKEGIIIWQTVKRCKRMLSNIIDGSDRTDHFNRIIPKRIIEICRQLILLFAWFKRGCEAGLDFTIKKNWKSQDLWPNEAGQPDNG